MTQPAVRRKGEYGVDAPIAPALFSLAALIFAGLGLLNLLQQHPRSAIPPLAAAIFFVLQTASFLYTTRRGKFIAWSRVLDGLRWRGDEQVLDMGCGRGAVLTLVAERLASGQVTGADIWKTADQSGNSMTACRDNCVLEGVDSRVRLQTADMRSLPFDAGTFDLVVSSLAIHNISGALERAKAVAEAVRVLKPGGQLLIADIKYTSTYAREFERLGMGDVTSRSLGWRFWYGNPFASTSLVSARKPGGDRSSLR